MTMVDHRRSRILTAAQEVFAEHGFRSADVKTIAERAGVGKATIYKFFDSKESLLLTIVEENLNHIRDIALKQLISNKPPLDRLRGVCLDIARFLSGNREFSRVLIQEAGEFAGDIQRQHLALMEQYLPLAEVFFNEMRKDGYFTALDTRATMQLMVNVLIGTTYTWALTGSGDIEEQALLYMDVLVEGLKQTP
ncbi:MAG: TetR/AcrR family transcriptional regulator [Alcanivoracaceae bacterium]|nr:TetR/AcrR family transcriptional regulator [Alcanivoracaceae bacterium]